MIECSMLAPTGNMEADIRALYDAVIPIYHEYWEARGRAWHNVGTARVDAVLLAQTWSTRVLKVMVARDGGDVVGLLIGMSLPPMLCSDQIFEVQMYWGRTPEVERALLDRLSDAFQYFTDQFISIPDYEDSGAELRLPVLRRRGFKIHGATA